jgi:ribosomal protein S18 acetylase RimI-like enzyme
MAATNANAMDVDNSLIEIANKYVNMIQKKRKTYKFIGPTRVEGTTTGNEYKLHTKEGTFVGSCTIYKGTNEPITLSLRKEKIVDKDTFHISWLGIEETFRRQGLATDLLLYGICELYTHHPDVTYVTLDDDTSGVHSSLDMRNIYLRLGFLPRDNFLELSKNGKKPKIQTDAPNQVKGVSGPERITSTNHLIGAIVLKHLKEMEPVKNGGSHRKRVQTMRRAKKTHRVKKTRRTKKTRYTRR